MSFSKIRYGQEEIFTTTVDDIDGRELEKFKVNKKDFLDVVDILTKKFSLKRKHSEKKTKELDWALR